MNPGATVSPAASMVRAARLPREAADFGDLAAANPHVAHEGWIARAVDDTAVGNEEVEVLGRRDRGQPGEKYAEFS